MDLFDFCRGYGCQNGCQICIFGFNDLINSTPIILHFWAFNAKICGIFIKGVAFLGILF